MKLDYTTEKLKRITAEVILIGILAIAGNSYYNFFREINSDTGEMANLIKNSPRTEYVVKEGDRLDSLRTELFPMYPKEFKALDNKFLAYNQDGWRKEIYGGGYKQLVANNIWANIIKKENKICHLDHLFDVYRISAGDTLKVPIRK